MKNLKAIFEKEDASFWHDTSFRIPKGKKPRKFRNKKSANRVELQKQSHRFRSSWE